MDFQIRYSEQAAQDISDIIGYIANELFNSQAAERFYHAVNKRLGLISKSPHMYPLSLDERLCAEGYRVAVIGNYLMFYLVDDDNAVVTISRIVYGRKDLIELIIE